MAQENLKGLHHDEDIQVLGRAWNFRATDIADYRGMTTKLDNEIWLDWHDVLSNPAEARMHMYPSAEKNVGLGVKRMRMETWQNAIIALDSMMVEVTAPVEAGRVMELLDDQKIPRVQRVVLPTSNPSLIRLLDSLGGSQDKQPPFVHIMEWADLVRFAVAGAIVRPKKFLRQQKIA